MPRFQVIIITLPFVLLSGCSPGRRDSFPIPVDEAGPVSQTALEYPLRLDPDKELDQYSHTVWEEELPQNSVQVIMQCRDGYIWLGTQEGVVRFDGVNFEVFDRSNTPGINHNDITSIIPFSDDGLWVGTFAGGLFRFRNKRAVPFTTQDGLSSNTVTALAEDGTGGVWIGTSDSGIDHMDGDRIESYTVEDGLTDNHVQCLLLDRTGTLWIGTSSGISVLRDGEFSTFSGGGMLTGQSINALAEGRGGEIWAGTQSGLYSILGDKVRTFTTADGLSGNSVQSLHVDKENNVWIGTIGGVSRLRDGRFSSFTTRHGLPSNWVASLLVDRDGSLWIGTHGGGLNQLSAAKVTTYTTFHGLSDDFIYTITAAGDGGIWSGAFTGDIDRLVNGRFQQVLQGSRLGSTRIRTLLEDSDENLWIGTDEALFRYTGGRLITFGEEDGLPDAPIRVISQDRQGTVWIGTDGAGLFRMEGDLIIPFSENQGLPADLAIRAIHQDREGNLWIGTYSGLSVLNENTRRTYTTADGLSSNYVRAIHESSDGTLWIGTYGGGLNRFRNGEFDSFTSLDGLLSDSIYQILEDDGGELWMSCNKGVFAVSPQELDAFTKGEIDRIESWVFNESDGMRSRECNGGYPAGVKLPGDSALWYPTMKGIVRIDPDDMPINNVPPPVVIETFSADGDDIDFSSAVVVPSSTRRLEFQYAALSYVSPDKVRYRFQLEGFEEEMVDAGSRRSASYTRIPPGNYRFRVIAANADDKWNNVGAWIDFRLKPAFYQTIWFLFASILLLLTFIYGVFRWRLHSLQMREQILQKKVEEAVTRIKVLSGLLPICGHCKKIRDDLGYWNQIEDYVRKHSEAEFSHGLCPDCIREHYPEFADRVGKRARGEDPESAA